MEKLNTYEINKAEEILKENQDISLFDLSQKLDIDVTQQEEKYIELSLVKFRFNQK